jgi:hypothetical protein
MSSFSSPGIALEQEFRRVPGSEHTQDMFDSQPTAAHDGLATEDVRIHRDAFQKLLFVYRSSSARIPAVRGTAADCRSRGKYFYLTPRTL